jgi:glutaredoxin 3
MAEIELYTTMFCPYCGRARGRTSVPQIFINGEHIGGSDELVALDRAGELDARLGLTK